MFTIHKDIDDTKPTSFTNQMTEEHFGKTSGTSLPNPPLCKAFVKPNENFGKDEATLDSTFWPRRLCCKCLDEQERRSRLVQTIILDRSIKCTDGIGVNERFRSFILRYRRLRDVGLGGLGGLGSGGLGFGV